MESIKSLSNLSGKEYALLPTDPNTGTPVNSKGEWLKKGDEQYLLFNSESSARTYAKVELEKNTLLEWALYNSNQEQVDVIHNREALIKEAKTRHKGFLKTWLVNKMAQFRRS